jgi:serine protease inhibitor
MFPRAASLSFLMSLAFSLALTACQSDPGGPQSDPKSRELLVSLSTAEKERVRGDNGFGFRLFSGLAEAKAEGNIIVSPLSVSIAMTMAYNGARGATETAMAAPLGYAGMSRADVNAFYAKLVPALSNADAKVRMRIANSVWSDLGLEVEPAFLDLNRASFDAEVRTLDFSAPTTVPVINKWVSGKTGGLIPEVLKAPLDPDLVMLLINALYFKGAWTEPFDPKRTYDGIFHPAEGVDKPCRMMTADERFLYHSDAKVNALELPYGDSLFSMVFLQPKEATGMAGLIADLADGAWEGWRDKFAPVKGVIHVPKFKSEYGETLNDVLKAMGMGPAFDMGADFTGIRKIGGIFISKVIHNTFVNVDEKGTEAAAVTVVEMGTLSMPMDLIKLDRPFVFAIREKSSGAILFLGRIMDPGL